MKNQNSKIQNLLNFGKIKYGQMGNFISFPNINFAKFYLCKKDLKTKFLSLFSLEKDLFANFSEKSRGSLQFSLPVVHGVKQTARRRRAVAPACSARPLTLGRRPHQAHLAPRPLNLPLSSSQNHERPNPSAAVIRHRRRLEPHLAVLSPPSEPPCLAASPRARTAAEMS